MRARAAPVTNGLEPFRGAAAAGRSMREPGPLPARAHSSELLSGLDARFSGVSHLKRLRLLDSKRTALIRGIDQG